MRALRERCAAFAADGHLELYKSTKRYDGAVGREQHGYPPPFKAAIVKGTFIKECRNCG